MMASFGEEPLRSWHQAWLGGHRHPGYLLAGHAPAQNKREAAVTAAGWILCKAYPGEACGSCIPCGQVRTGTHPDLTIIRPDGRWIKVEQIRGVLEQVALAPFGSGERVILIEEAQHLGPAAANAFLKTLEEPPQRCTFFLIAPTAGSLPATIVSRLQRLTFPPRGLTAPAAAAEAETFLAPLSRRGAVRTGLMNALQNVAKEKNPAARSQLFDLYENYLRRMAAGELQGPYGPRAAAEALGVVSRTRRQVEDSTASAGLQLLAMMSQLIHLVERGP